MGRPRLSLAALLFAAAGCGYSPNPPSMKLICGPMSSCPEGYQCVANTCWKPGDVQLVSKLVGHWVFGTSSKQNLVCSDGSTNTSNLAGPDGYIDVQSGTSSALATYFYCAWNLDLSGSSTVIEAGQSCSGKDTKNPDITYTWHGETLALASPDGKSGSLSGSFPYSYTINPAGSPIPTGSGTCMLHISADLTKN